MPEQKRRLDRVLEASYVEGLGSLPMDELRAKRVECDEIETELSYVRRLAQARLEIIEAEGERRAQGGSLAELIARLPELLGDGGSRPDPAHSRLPQTFAPSPAITWNRGKEHLVSDATLVNLPTLSPQELTSIAEELRALESDLSRTRAHLHQVLQTLEKALAERVAAGSV